jgi:hypothetical protein
LGACSTSDLARPLIGPENEACEGITEFTSGTVACEDPKAVFVIKNKSLSNKIKTLRCDHLLKKPPGSDGITAMWVLKTEKESEIAKGPGKSNPGICQMLGARFMADRCLCSSNLELGVAPVEPMDCDQGAIHAENPTIRIVLSPSVTDKIFARGPSNAKIQFISDPEVDSRIPELPSRAGSSLINVMNEIIIHIQAVFICDCGPKRKNRGDGTPANIVVAISP